MAYALLAILLSLLALFPLWLAARLLLRRAWLLRFLQGLCGIGLLGVALGMALLAADLYSYRAVRPGTPVLTVAIDGIGEQRFGLLLIDERGRERNVKLSGDLWQLQLRLLQPAPWLQALGVATGYRLEQVDARYLALEQEAAFERQPQPLDAISRRPDTWPWLQRHGALLGLRASSGRLSHQPLRDGAVFAVVAAPGGLALTPLNEQAQHALRDYTVAPRATVPRQAR